MRFGIILKVFYEQNSYQFKLSQPGRLSTSLDVHSHTYTASSCGLVSFPRKRESRRRALMGLDARLRGHDVLLASDLRNRHLV